MMQCFQGKSVYEGIAVGKVAVLKRNDPQVKCRQIEDADAEILRIEQAIELSKEQLRKIYQKAVREIGESDAAIFEVHQMILDDKNLLNLIYRIVRTEMVNAEYAVTAAGNQFVQRFEAMEDELVRARKADIEDLIFRLVKNLTGQWEQSLILDEPVIIVAKDLSPSETMQLDKSKILAFVTVRGSANSHTAILARIMNIPALVGTELTLSEVEDGTPAVVDGFGGQFILSPDQETYEAALHKIQEEEEQFQSLQELKGKENITLSGKKIEVFANIGSVDDIEAALNNDAGGIGLLRSEFLYLGRADFPTEEEQYQAYKQAVEKVNGKKMIIRTLDIGVDKQISYFKLGKEENPALGYRGIRICLKQPEMFKTQLRALLRAAIYGELSIMYPMIVSVEEVEQIQRIVEEAAQELEIQKIPYRIPQQGIMIETPAAALVSDELAQMVDFFSIGTNDLTQYTLAIDRQNEKLDDFYNPYHKAVLKMIQMVVDSGHKYGKWVGICGELGADTALTETFIKMGVDELSVAPSMVLKLRKVIRMLP